MPILTDVRRFAGTKFSQVANVFADGGLEKIVVGGKIY